MSVDMLVLLVGMRANDSNADFAASAGLRQAPSGFMEPQDLFLNSARSGVDGIFTPVRSPRRRISEKH